MPCRRCSGMMVRDRALDEIGRADHFIWRCILCGDIIDPVILINRTDWPPTEEEIVRAKGNHLLHIKFLISPLIQGAHHDRLAR